MADPIKTPSADPYQNDPSREPAGLVWVSKVSYLLDEQFRLPGTKFRFGLDPIVNFIPFVGDMTSFLVSAGLILTMVRKGASHKLVVLMSINIILDATLGAIPVIGQIFDFFFKANTRNFELMKEHYLQGKHQGSGKSTIAFALVILVVILALLIFALWKTADWLLGLFS